MAQRRIRIGFPASKYRTVASAPLALTTSLPDSNAVYKKIVTQGTDRIQVGYGSSSYYSADVLLGDGSFYPGSAGVWDVNSGGDWLDANGVFNGTTHYVQAAFPLNATSAQFDISGIDGDILLKGLFGWDSAQIDGQPAVSFVMWPNNHGSIGVPKYDNQPHSGIVMNPLRGSTLTINRSSWLGTPQTATIDKVAGPLIQSYPMGTTSNTPNLFVLDLSSESALINQVGSFNMAQPYAYNPEFITDPQTGLRYFRFSGGPTTGPRLISWFLLCQPQDHAFCRYCLYIEDDVADGMVETGMKLPGFGTNTVNDNFVSLRAEHGQPSKVPGNRGLYKLIQYVYEYNNNPILKPFDRAILRAEQWNVIEQEVKLNTPGQSDGIMRVWINDNMVFESTSEVFRGPTGWDTVQLAGMQFNVYHGGNNPPAATIHERIAAVGISTQRIGIPPELLVNRWPAWRRSMTTLDTAYPITSTLPTILPSAVADVFTGYAITDKAMFGMPGTGHYATDPSYPNGVWKCDLTVDAPAWVEDCLHTPPSLMADPHTAPRYELDGKPVPAQTYTNTWFVPGSTLPDGKDRIFCMGRSACHISGDIPAPYSTMQVDGYRIDDKAWDVGGPAPGGPSVGGTWNDIPLPNNNGIFNWSMVSDQRTGYIYYCNGNMNQSTHINRFKPGVNTSTGGATEVLWNWFSGPVTGINISWLGWAHTGLCIDTKRNRVLNINAHNGSPRTLWIEYIDLGTLVFSQIACSGYDANLLNRTDTSTIYDEDNDRYITIMGFEVWATNPDSGACTLIVTLPTQANHGINNRFAYMKDLGGIVLHTTGGGTDNNNVFHSADYVRFIPTRTAP